MGDGRLSAPLERRGLGIRNGECGPGSLAGDCCRRGEPGSPERAKLRRFLSKLLSDDGESVRIARWRAEESTLLSLLSPASISASEVPRRDDWDVLSKPAALLCDRGVGHSIGLLDSVDTAVDRDLASPGDGCNSSGELRIDMVNADTDGGGCKGSSVGGLVSVFCASCCSPSSVEQDESLS